MQTNDLSSLLTRVRIANFSATEIPAEHVLDLFDLPQDEMLKQIRVHADLPYVFVCAAERVDAVRQLLSDLRSIRSCCYPFALYLTGTSASGGSDPFSQEPELDRFQAGAEGPQQLVQAIRGYAASKFAFDKEILKIANAKALPDDVDVVIVGAGVTGLYAARKLRENGISFCILDKGEMIGGIWSMYANATSQVNTSECAYRLVENSVRANRDHSPTREILQDIFSISRNIRQYLFLNSTVEWIEKEERLYRTRVRRNQQVHSVKSKGVILAINDRVGVARKISWPNQERFGGKIFSGISDEIMDFDWRGKKVAVVGMGAYGVENSRTFLEAGAEHVTVVCRRHGTVCPKIIDYLNFATPYDENFLHDKKSNIRNMMMWKKLYDLSGAKQPECWMGKIKHEGHTISVSDIWFIGHFLGKIDTVVGSITAMDESGIIVDGSRKIEADAVVNCVGFHRNANIVKDICGYRETYNVNYLDKDMIYLADAFIDDNAFNSFFGSSVLEMVRFYMDVYVHFFDSDALEAMLTTEGVVKVPIEERKWSHYISGANALIGRYPDIRQKAADQVARRTQNFMQSFDLGQYIAVNRREWIETHRRVAGKALPPDACLPYPFEKLIEKKV